jgi:hypothetical protein
VEASHEIHVRSEDRWGQAQTTGPLGAITRDEGDERRAIGLVRESAELAHDVGVAWWECGALAELASLSVNAGLLDHGEAHARKSLAMAERFHDRAGRAFGVGILARVAAERGEQERAGRLWGAIEAEQAGAPLGGWRRHRDACEARILELAGPNFEQARAEGRSLTLDAAVALALGRDREAAVPGVDTQAVP